MFWLFARADHLPEGPFLNFMEHMFGWGGLLVILLVCLWSMVKGNGGDL